MAEPHFRRRHPIWSILLSCLLLLPAAAYCMHADFSRSPAARAAEDQIPDGKAEKSLADWQKINEETALVLNFPQDNGLFSLPVLETDTPDYYMTHDPYRRSDSMGSLFLDHTAAPSENSQNLVIYGHSSTRNQRNLTFLKQYADQVYYQAHQVFDVESQSGHAQYRIVSFARYDLQAEEVCLSWLENHFGSAAEAKQMFADTAPYLLQKTAGIRYTGQPIITLVTCDMTSQDVRFVLQAVQEC